MTDIEIAQAANPLKIGEIAQAAGVEVSGAVWKL